MIRRSLLLAAGLLALVPASGQAAPPNPFGHACVPQDGVLFCPTASDPSACRASTACPSTWT